MQELKNGLKIILGMAALISLSSPSSAVDVDCYDDFQQAYTKESTNNVITLTDDIMAARAIGTPSADLTVIEGQGHVIDGNHCGGIELNEHKKLEINDVILKNFTSLHGGVINNNSGCKVETLSGEFTDNYSQGEGGVIFNDGEIGSIKGAFKSNTSENNGGVIFNDYTGTIDELSGEFTENKSINSTGGSICNFGIMGKISGTFNSNSVLEGNGGAINNIYLIDLIEGTFENNYAKESGGAIFNTGEINQVKGVFRNNLSDCEADYTGGGAILNYGNINKLSGTFENNTSKGRGGAIYNAYGTINIISDEEETIFSGNTDMTGSNAIYNDSGIINLNAGNYDIVINDAISGGNTYDEADSIININSSEVNGVNYGNVILRNNISDNIVNMYNGTLKPEYNDETGTYGNFTDNVKFNYYGGCIDLRDNNLHNTNFGNLTLNNNMDLKLDVDFEALKTDTFSADSFNSNGYNIDISDINLLTSTEEKRFSVCPFSDDMNEDVRLLLQESIIYTAGDVINSPIYRYRTWYEQETGLINFERVENADKYNPAILVSPVAAQLGGYLTQLNSYDEAFRKMDMYMLNTLQERLSMKRRNRYASLDNDVRLYSQIESNNSRYGWLRPYTIIEKVLLKNGPKVRNILYGSFFGIESEVIELKRGWDLILGGYGGFNGSHQTYYGNSIYQNGGTFGALLMMYKNNYFSGWTANISSNGCEASTMYGHENFAMLMSGLASKNGYNYEFKNGKYIIQPNILLAYTNIETFSYRNGANVKINPRPLNAIEIAPGCVLIGNFKDGWQPFANVYMIWNLIDKAKFKANDVSLPILSIKPFVFYGIGVRKKYGDRFSGYSQTYVTQGGRNGVGIQFGFRWAI